MCWPSGSLCARVLPGAVHTITMEPTDVALAQRLKTQHDATLGVVEQIRAVADGLSTQDRDLAPVRTLQSKLELVLLPHERADEELLVPLVGRAFGGAPATTALSRTHAEIEHQVGRLRRLLDALEGEAATARGRDRVPSAALRALWHPSAPQRHGERGRLQSDPLRRTLAAHRGEELLGAVCRQPQCAPGNLRHLNLDPDPSMAVSESNRHLASVGLSAALKRRTRSLSSVLNAGRPSRPWTLRSRKDSLVGSVRRRGPAAHDRNELHDSYRPRLCRRTGCALAGRSSARGNRPAAQGG